MKYLLTVNRDRTPGRIPRRLPCGPDPSRRLAPESFAVTPLDLPDRLRGNRGRYSVTDLSFTHEPSAGGRSNCWGQAGSL